MSDSAAQAGGRVLATLNADGSRRWLRPRVSPGRFLQARRLTAYALIVLFTAAPHISIGGAPLLRLDVAARRFSIFGHTFLPTDTALMALIFIAVFFTIFLVTALFGRVWCGWACPQTVYMEFVYRPIERLFEGSPGRKRKITGAKGARRLAKYVVFLIVSLFLAHTFLAYFVEPRKLIAWVTGSPFDHPTAFLVVMITTGLMMFDFCFFREQTCLVACPYGRFQAAMLDRHSLIVTYDKRRGEPRGRKRRSAQPQPQPGGDVSLDVIAEPGDCVDCTLCVQTCPTGIDIRQGLQMECIGCAQCIDACDAVMEKLGRPRGLIRYSSDAIMEGKARSIVRPRMFLYPAALAILVTVFALLVGSRQSAEVRLLPRQASPFSTLPDGSIANQTRLRVVNRSDETATYRVSVSGIEGAGFAAGAPTITLEPTQSEVLGFVIACPPDVFVGRGMAEATLTVTDGDEFTKSLTYKLIGPASRPRPTPQPEDGP